MLLAQSSTSNFRVLSLARPWPMLGWKGLEHGQCRLCGTQSHDFPAGEQVEDDAHADVMVECLAKIGHLVPDGDVSMLEYSICKRCHG